MDHRHDYVQERHIGSTGDSKQGHAALITSVGKIGRFPTQRDANHARAGVRFVTDGVLLRFHGSKQLVWNQNYYAEQ